MPKLKPNDYIQSAHSAMGVINLEDHLQECTFECAIYRAHRQTRYRHFYPQYGNDAVWHFSELGEVYGC